MTSPAEPTPPDPTRPQYRNEGIRTLLAMFDHGDPEERLLLGQILQDLQQSAFGVFLFVAILPAFIPIPGIGGAVSGPLVILIGAQMLCGMRRPWLPGFIRNRGPKRGTMHRFLERINGPLRRLDRLLHEHGCRRLVFLGDFLHARQGAEAPLWPVLTAWRAGHPHLAIDLVRGNHDRHAGDPPAALGFSLHHEPLALGPFALQHEPEPHPALHVLAGHLHPTFRLRGPGRQSLRLPCFRLGERLSLLPAFGEFTGGMDQAMDNATRVFVCGDGGVWPAFPG